MIVPKVIDKRVVWLEGICLQAEDILTRIKRREIAGITLTTREENMAELCSAYLYMLQLTKEYGLFESDDPFNLFNKETLH